MSVACRGLDGDGVWNIHGALGTCCGITSSDAFSFVIPDSVLGVVRSSDILRMQ